MAIVDNELFSLEHPQGGFITVFEAGELLRIVVGSPEDDDPIGSIDLDEINAGRLRRAINDWLAARNK